MSDQHHRSVREQWTGLFGCKAWVYIPFQPILYLFMFVGTVAVMVTPGFPIEIAQTAYLWWLTTSLVVLPLFFVSCWMIAIRPGRIRMIGYWLRIFADAGQLFAMCALVWWTKLRQEQTSYVQHDLDLFWGWVLLGVLAFVVATIIRDIYRLVYEYRRPKESRGA